MKTVRYRSKGRVISGILMLVSIIFLFLAFIGTSFVSIGALSGGVSPALTFIGSFALIAAGGAYSLLGILYALLFLAAIILPIITGIMILVNKKYFPPLIAMIVYCLLCLLFLIVGILAASLGSYLSMAGLGIGGLRGALVPTLWLFMGAACVIVPVFLARKEVILPPPPPQVETVPYVDPMDMTNVTGHNAQGVEVQVNYTDDSGTHKVRRQVYTDRPMTIGRSKDCLITLDDQRASSMHARLWYDSLNGMVIEDNASSNGIQVNGDTIMNKCRLTATDSVRIGDSKLTFKVLGRLDDMDGEKTMPSGVRYHEPVRILLSFVDDGGPRKENITLKERARIGRDRDCEISIDSNTVSRRHAILKNIGGNRVSIIDDASSNYVYVQGDKIEGETELHDGDKIGLGDVTITLTYPKA